MRWFYSSRTTRDPFERITSLWHLDSKNRLEFYLNLGNCPTHVAQNIAEGLELRDKAIRAKEREANRKAREEAGQE